MAARGRSGFTLLEARESVLIAQSLSCRVDVHKTLAVRTGDDEFVVAHISRAAEGHGMTEPQPKRAVYTACVHLSEFSGYDVWCDERVSTGCGLPAGSIHINDMRHSWYADIQGRFDVVNFCIPQSALDEVIEDQSSTRIDELRCPMSEARIDTIAMNLARALIPALMRPNEVNRLFVDHAWRAVTAHLARTYGYGGRRVLSGQSGLAPWQERRAKEMLLADLSGSVSIADLSSACRLSCSHFSQAFRQTVGCPPHQWLLTQRVERSKQLLLNTDQPLSEIALVTGFADQSHFTRVFSQRVRVSPGVWRREQAR
ncbi:AraC family transcriptional regulator [Bradyrhizobium canariense]|nr:AraC family transcriptional regulator [Bradyrhizobium canariense]